MSRDIAALTAAIGTRDSEFAELQERQDRASAQVTAQLQSHTLSVRGSKKGNVSALRNYAAPLNVRTFGARDALAAAEVDEIVDAILEEVASARSEPTSEGARATQ